MPFVLALDQGTTSSRAIVFDGEGAIVAVAQRELTQHYPRTGWVEHDPQEIWASQVEVAIEVLGRAHVDPCDIAAVGIANQRETAIVWDRDSGEPIYPAIVWQDRRTAEYCEQLKADGAGPLVQRTSGLVIDPYFSASKIHWMLTHVPGARARAEAGRLAFGTVDSWLLWKLTNGSQHATDASNASRTMLFDITAGRWDPELLRLFDVPASMLPEVRPSSGVCGRASASLGLGDSPIAAIAGDQQAALFGQLCLEPGMSKNTYGTGCFLLQNVGTTPKPSRHQLLSTVAWQIDGRTDYALEGSVFIGGAVVQWIRDGLELIRSASDIEALATSVPDSGGVVLVPAFTGLGAPHWDPFARGGLFGLTRGTTGAHIARAALEAIAFQVAELLDAMTADSGVALTELRVDGGAAANDTLMQMQADVLGKPVVRSAVTETTALGAAYLAGLAVGLWPSAAALSDRWRADRRFEPARDARSVELQRQRWAEAVRRTRGWTAGS
jgi:glycerol kinase